MSENTDEKFTAIQDTVHGMQLKFVEMKADQKATNKSVKEICGKLDRYAEGTEQRITSLESNVGSRNPDDPTAFSQLQALMSFMKRTKSGLNKLWTLGTAIVLVVIGQILSSLGWFGKGH